MTQLTPIRGFVNTPVVKTICIALTVSAVFVSVFQLKHFFRLALDPFIVEYSQYWRLLTFQATFVNESDYLLGIVLWFQFKVLERFYGSRKFLSLVIVFVAYNAVVTFLVMSLGQLLINFVDFLVLKIFKSEYKFVVTFLNSVCAGPVGVLSTLYVCYGHYIPVSYSFQIMLKAPRTSGGAQENAAAATEDVTDATSTESDGNGATPVIADAPVSSSRTLVLTDHFQIHVIYTLLLINNGLSSIVPGLVGLFIGKLFVSDVLPGAKTWMLPNFVFRLFVSPSKTLRRFGNSLAARAAGYRRLPNAAEQANEEMGHELSDNDNDNDADNDDREQIVDDIRNNSYNEIRAETPVRPLASQFLDTFRNTN